MTTAQEEIKATFKTQVLKWHLQRNTKMDTTLRIQEINEAYLTLKASEAIKRYNIEYQLYKQYQRQQKQRH